MLKNKHGMSLIEVLVVMSLLMIIGMGAATLITNQQKEMKAIGEKMTSNEVRLQLQNFILNTNSCQCLFRNKTFNTTNLANPWNTPLSSVPLAYNLPIPAAPTACTAIAQSIVPPVGTQLGDSNLKIASIQTTNVTSIGSGSYVADLEVKFDVSNAVRAIKGISVPFQFSVDTSTGSPTARPFQECLISVASNAPSAIATQPGTNYRSAFINNWDGPLNFTCPGNKFMMGIHSINDNGHEDRRYDFECEDYMDEKHQPVTRQNCSWSSEVNNWDAAFDWNCPGDRWIAGTSSVHDNGHEDRRFKFYCCEMKTDHKLIRNEIFYTFAQMLDREMRFSCPNGTAMTGELSIHDNGDEDRFAYKACAGIR